MTARAVQPSGASNPLVEVTDLAVSFRADGRRIHAVNGIDLSLKRGEVLTILGESGSGKSVTLRALMRLLPENRTTINGQMSVAGHDVLGLSANALERYRGRMAAMIFQEPSLAFDPVYTVGYQIAETITRHEGITHDAAMKRALDLFERVRIPSARRRLQAYPHEMSGGMRQRAMIALALSCHPALLLADEPTTALDASVQIQILLLLRELQKEMGMGVIFVTHDVGVAVEIADRVSVMYAGRFVETGTLRDVVKHPTHPYTIGLMRSRADSARKGQRLEAIPGAPPDLGNLPQGCSFAPRCRFADETCENAMPAPVTVSHDHQVRCSRLEAVHSAT